MTRPLVTYPDPERAIVDYLTAALADAGETVTVGVGVPHAWKPKDRPHVSVAWDGTPWSRRFVAIRAAMRITVRAATTTEAKRIALLAEGLLHARPGVRPQLGVMPTRDEDTDAELAWFTVGVLTRSTPIAG